MTWQLALTLSIVAGVIRVLFLRRYALNSRVPATIPPAVSYLFGVLPVGLIAGFLVFPHQILWSWTIIILMTILSLSMTFSNWLGFIAASKIAVAPTQTIGMLTNVGVILMGWALLGEGLTMPQFVGGGILLVAAGVAIAAPAKVKAKDFERIKPSALLVAISSAVLLAIGLVTEKALMNFMQIGGIFLVSWTIQTFGMLLLASKDMSRSTWNKFRGKELRSSIFLGLANGLNGALYIYAIFHADNISLVTLLSTISLPLTVLGAYLFLKEREHHFMMWLSVGISCLGLLIMALR